MTMPADDEFLFTSESVTEGHPAQHRDGAESVLRDEKVGRSRILDREYGQHRRGHPQHLDAVAGDPGDHAGDHPGQHRDDQAAGIEREHRQPRRVAVEENIFSGLQVHRGGD
jgi:hypothetical protein